MYVSVFAMSLLTVAVGAFLSSSACFSSCFSSFSRKSASSEELPTI